MCLLETQVWGIVYLGIIYSDSDSDLELLLEEFERTDVRFFLLLLFGVRPSLFDNRDPLTS